MSSTTVGAGAASSNKDAVGAIRQDKTTTRRYVKFGSTDDGQGNVTKTITKSSILTEKEKKEPEKLKDGTPNPHAGMSTDWADAERDGFEVFNDNDIVSYSVTSWDGAELLNPDPAMRLYIYNRGLATFQTAVANALMKSLKEETSGELVPEFNGITVDLRVGIDEEGNYSINKQPARRAVDPEDKMIKTMRAAGVPEDKIAAILAIVRASTAVTAEVAAAPVEEVEVA